MKQANLINGEKPQFGNLKHIAYVKEKAAYLSGEKSFHSIEWHPVLSLNLTSSTGKPLFVYAEENQCDSLFDYIPCQRCGRMHVLLFHYDHSGNWYDELISVDDSAKEFSCWNCGQQFITDDDRNVFCVPKEL